jgi:hypothetical protein
MSIEITVYASDIRDFDKEVDRKFDISNEHGYNLFDDEDRLTLENYPYALEPYTYLTVMVEMQEQINNLVDAQAKQDKKIDVLVKSIAEVDSLEVLKRKLTALHVRWVDGSDGTSNAFDIK